MKSFFPVSHHKKCITIHKDLIVKKVTLEDDGLAIISSEFLRDYIHEKVANPLSS